ncbi:DUF4282 domain-containing protein [Actinomadura craniellae]|uniref:DUF4282 domain-containing protein n=1 Tax=Actinomadura craniellae TaxID=2231787 RepID=UPI001314885E|nr:DUF4282 domain-containing protein [Actinomadura craniellae]
MANPYGPGPQQPGWPQQPGQQYQHQQPGYPPPAAGHRFANDKGFFGALFDFSFDNFIAPKLVKFLYILLLILVTVGGLVYLVIGFTMLASGTDAGVLGGLLVIVLTPVIWLLSLMMYRVMLELMIVVFKISEDIKDIRDSRTLR